MSARRFNTSSWLQPASSSSIPESSPQQPSQWASSGPPQSSGPDWAQTDPHWAPPWQAWRRDGKTADTPRWLQTPELHTPNVPSWNPNVHDPNQIKSNQPRQEPWVFSFESDGLSSPRNAHWANVQSAPPPLPPRPEAQYSPPQRPEVQHSPPPLPSGLSSWQISKQKIDHQDFMPVGSARDWTRKLSRISERSEESLLSEKQIAFDPTFYVPPKQYGFSGAQQARSPDVIDAVPPKSGPRQNSIPYENRHGISIIM